MGAMNVVLEGYEDVVDQINSMQRDSAKVINRTIGDFKTRGPGWVSQEVVKEYNIKKKEINSSKKGVKNAGKIRISGVSIDSLELHYKGRLLTPTHFSMKPTSRPQNGKAYTVTAQIKKREGRKVLGSKVFLAKSGRDGTKHIPFQRRSEERYPIDAIKTVSVPQMITNDIVSENIHKRINDELGKRLEHNLNYILGRR